MSTIFQPKYQGYGRNVVSGISILEKQLKSMHFHPKHSFIYVANASVLLQILKKMTKNKSLHHSCLIRKSRAHTSSKMINIIREWCLMFLLAYLMKRKDCADNFTNFLASFKICRKLGWMQYVIHEMHAS